MFANLFVIHSGFIVMAFLHLYQRYAKYDCYFNTILLYYSTVILFVFIFF